MLFIWCVLMTLYQPLKLLFWLATSLQYFTPYGCLWVHAYTSINCDQLSTTYSLCWKPLIRVTDTNNKGQKIRIHRAFLWPWTMTLTLDLVLCVLKTDLHIKSELSVSGLSKDEFEQNPDKHMQPSTLPKWTCCWCAQGELKYNYNSVTLLSIKSSHAQVTAVGHVVALSLGAVDCVVLVLDDSGHLKSSTRLAGVWFVVFCYVITLSNCQ